jgi:hypothetical protein
MKGKLIGAAALLLCVGGSQLSNAHSNQGWTEESFELVSALYGDDTFWAHIVLAPQDEIVQWFLTTDMDVQQAYAQANCASHCRTVCGEDEDGNNRVCSYSADGNGGCECCCWDSNGDCDHCDNAVVEPDPTLGEFDPRDG